MNKKRVPGIWLYSRQNGVIYYIYLNSTIKTIMMLMILLTVFSSIVLGRSTEITNS